MVKEFISVLIISVVVSTPSWSQIVPPSIASLPCSDAAMNISVHGLKLGMTKREVDSVVPGVKWSRPEDVTINYSVSVISPFKDLKTLRLETFEDKLYRIEATYRHAPSDSVAFADRLRFEWKLDESWLIGLAGRRHEIRCFERKIETLDGSSFGLTDWPATLEMVKQRNASRPIKP